MQNSEARKRHDTLTTAVDDKGSLPPVATAYPDSLARDVLAVSLPTNFVALSFRRQEWIEDQWVVCGRVI